MYVLRLVEQHAPGRRAFAVEGTGSFGAGLTRFLARHDERVLEVGRLRRERQSGKSDALDAIRAARSVLGQGLADARICLLVGSPPPLPLNLGLLVRQPRGRGPGQTALATAESTKRSMRGRLAGRPLTVPGPELSTFAAMR